MVARLTAFATERNTVLYISGEESQAQVRMRASRIGAMEPNLLLASTTDLSTVLGLIEQFKPALAIVDSAQTIVSQARRWHLRRIHAGARSGERAD